MRRHGFESECMPGVRQAVRIEDRRCQRGTSRSPVWHEGVWSGNRIPSDGAVLLRRCRPRMVERPNAASALRDPHFRSRSKRERGRGYATAAQLHSAGVLLREAVPAAGSGLGLRVQYHSGLVISPHEFEQLVGQALDELPQRFASLLENVAVVVEEEPSDEDLNLLDD